MWKDRISLYRTFEECYKGSHRAQIPYNHRSPNTFTWSPKTPWEEIEKGASCPHQLTLAALIKAALQPLERMV